MHNRTLARLALLALLIVVIGGWWRVMPARAEPISEVEPNNTNATAQTLTAIGADNPVNAAINAAGDIDWFRFDAVAGRTYVIEIFNAAAALGGQGMACTGGGFYFGEAGLGLRAYAASGALLINECDAARNSAGNSHHFVSVLAPANGMIAFVVIPNDPNASGFYSLRVTPRYDEPGASHAADQEPNNTRDNAYRITPGYASAVTSDIAPRHPIYSTFRADHDWYVFDAVAGRTYVAELSNVSSGLAAQGTKCNFRGVAGGSGLGLLVYTSSGAEFAGECGAKGFAHSAGNYHNVIQFTPSSSGPYFIRIQPNDSNSSGGYTLRVLPKYDEPGAGWDATTFEPNNAIWNAYGLSLGSNNAVTSDIELRNPIYSTFYPDKDWYRFTATAGQTYVAELFNVSSDLLQSGLACYADGVVGGSGLSLLVHNPAGAKVAGHCSAGGRGDGAVHHRVQFVASVSGAYHLLVTPNNPNGAGSYSLRVCAATSGRCDTPASPAPSVTPLPSPTPSVTPPPSQQPSWLVLLYLAGDDLDPVTKLPTGFARSVNELLFRLRRMPYNPAVRLVVLYDGPGANNSRIYSHERQGLTDVTEQAATSPLWVGGFGGEPGNRELDTGSSVTLGNFIDWARATYPPTRYSMLAIVDHGGGWAPDFNDPPGQPRGGSRVQAGGWRGMSLDMHSGGSSLSTRATGRALNGVAPFDVLFYDACLMGMIETAYEIRNSADFLIAGQNVLFAELPYEVYLNAANLTFATTPRDLATSLVGQYNAGVNPFRHPFTTAAIDLRQLRSNAPNNLTTRVNTLAERILAALPDPAPASHPLVMALMDIYDQTQKFDYDSSLTIDPHEGYVDLVDFATRLSTSTDPAVPSDVKAAASAVAQSARGGATPVIVANRAVSGIYGNHEWRFDGANGLSIFLPLGERDERPTKVINPNEPAVSEPQLPYYADPAQLAFTRDAPAWANLLKRLEPSVLVRRVGSRYAAGVALTSDIQFDTRDFAVAVPQAVMQTVHLPLIQR